MSAAPFYYDRRVAMDGLDQIEIGHLSAEAQGVRRQQVKAIAADVETALRDGTSLRLTTIEQKREWVS